MLLAAACIVLTYRMKRPFSRRPDALYALRLSGQSAELDIAHVQIVPPERQPRVHCVSSPYVCGEGSRTHTLGLGVSVSMMMACSRLSDTAMSAPS